MTEDLSFEQMPYFMCSADDICKKRRLASPIFTISDFDFRLIFDKDIYKGRYVIRIIPEVEDQPSSVQQDPIRSSISIKIPYRIVEDFYFTFKETIRSNTAGVFARIVWMLEDAKILVMHGENRQNDVTFLFVFGPLDEYLKNTIHSLGSSCERHCVQRLVKNRNNQLNSTDSTILPKWGRDNIKDHTIIKFTDMIWNRISENDGLTELMTSEAFVNFITCTHLLGDIELSEDFIRQLYMAAAEHMIETCSIKASCRFAEILKIQCFPEAEILTARRRFYSNIKLIIAMKRCEDRFRNLCNYRIETLPE